MKTVLLLGDSIRQGYCREVALAFAGKAKVVFPEDNCRFAEYFLRHVSDWKEQLCPDGADVVHWNAGLWDCLIQYDDGPLTPPDIYRYYMDRICRRMKLLFPQARIIFANSTFVQEEKYAYPFVRYNADIRRYNDIAAEVTAEYGMELDDLYSVTEAFPDDWYTDMTHPYSARGRCALTRAVSGCVARALEMEVPEIAEDISIAAGTVVPVGI